MPASASPPAVASRHATTERTTFPVAHSHWLSCSNVMVCKLKEENVVKPPKIPIMKNDLTTGDTMNNPSGLVIPEIKPIRKHPMTLTAIVPHGNDSPTLLATQTDMANRRALPIAPPAMMARYSFTSAES